MGNGAVYNGVTYAWGVWVPVTGSQLGHATAAEFLSDTKIPLVAEGTMGNFTLENGVLLLCGRQVKNLNA
jgi:hypothetical protein